MGVVESVQGAIVGLDTAPLIYFIERHADYHPLVRPFFAALDRGELAVVTSTVTLVEVLVHPLRRQEDELVNQYGEILLHAEHLTTLPVSPEIAAQAARLRADHNLRTPDAIQLATALYSGANHFLTNDRKLAA